MCDKEKTVKLTKKQARPFVKALKLYTQCSNFFCGAALSIEDVYAYSHSDGEKIEGLTGLWQLFTHCPKYGSERSLRKFLRAPSKKEK